MYRSPSAGKPPAARRRALTGLIALLLLSACATAGGALSITPLAPTAEPTPPPMPVELPIVPSEEVLPTIAPITSAPEVIVEGLYDFPENVNPLTGLVVQDPSRLERRPVLVKVSNFPRTGRPHAGLSFADVVFEYYIGFGLNRFLGIYLGQDSSQVGPVRSGRLVDAQLGEMYQGLLFYGNADPQVEEVLAAELGPRALAEKFLPSPPKYRIGRVLDETTLFVNTAELTDYVNRRGEITNTGRDLRGMIFSEMIHPENQPGEHIVVQFWTTTRGEWRYDAASGKYLRWIEELRDNDPMEMIPLIDRMTGEQLSFSNVIILFASYVEYAPTLHDIRLYDNSGGKRAIFFRDGVMIEGTWKTVSNGRPIQFYNQWGLPMHLKPGNSWIVLAGDSSTFAEAAPSSWELRFDLP